MAALNIFQSSISRFSVFCLRRLKRLRCLRLRLKAFISSLLIILLTKLVIEDKTFKIGFRTVNGN